MVKECFSVKQVTDGKLQEKDYFVAQEVPVTICINQTQVVTFLCTPQHLDELALGYLLGEGIVKKIDDIEEIQQDVKSGMIYVAAKEYNKTAVQTLGKRYLTTGCGGGTSFYSLMDRKQTSRVSVDHVFPLSQLQEAMRYVSSNSELYASTGGVHTCALFSGQKLLVIREDVGRHNAADKVLGWFYRRQLNPARTYFVTTGRISSEILLKVTKAQIPLVLSRTAPTSLAVKLARELNVTVIGYMRGSRANIYAAAERIKVDC